MVCEPDPVIDGVSIELYESDMVPLSVNVGVENKLSDEHPDRDDDAVCVFWTKVCVDVQVIKGLGDSDKDKV